MLLLTRSLPCCNAFLQSMDCVLAFDEQLQTFLTLHQALSINLDLFRQERDLGQTAELQVLRSNVEHLCKENEQLTTLLQRQQNSRGERADLQARVQSLEAARLETLQVSGCFHKY